MIKVLLNTTLQPEKIRLKEVGTFTIRCMGHQSHGHWEPGCFALSLLLYQLVCTPLSPNCAVGIPRQGHELAQATSKNTHHAQSPHYQAHTSDDNVQ